MHFLKILLILTLIPTTVSGQDEKRTAFEHAYEQYKYFYQQGNLYQSLPEAKLAYELGQQLHGKQSEETAILTYNYGNNLLRLRKYDDAKPILTVALGSYEQVYGTKSIELVPVLLDLGHVYTFKHDIEIKRKLYKRAFELVEQHYGKDSVEYGWRSVMAGADMLQLAYDGDGEIYLKTGYKILQSSLGENDVKTGFAAYNLGKHELTKGNYKAAEQYLLITLASNKIPDGPPSKIELSAHAFLVRVYEELGKSELATQHCLTIGRMTPFKSNQDYFPVYKKVPSYPRSALAQHKEGFVVVEYEVDENGFVRNPEVIETQGGKKFEGPALDAAMKFRYAPRFVDGQSVSVKGVQNKFTFSITD
jgi:TonB family protein